MRSPIETKVALPALIMGPAIIIVPALYGLVRAYEVITPTPEQGMALVGLGVALQYVAHVFLGYRAPHTIRPDLPPEDVDVAYDVPADDSGSRRTTLNLGPRRSRPAHLDEGDRP